MTFYRKNLKLLGIYCKSTHVNVNSVELFGNVFLSFLAGFGGGNKFNVKNESF